MLMEVPCNPHAPGVSVFGRCLPLACEAHPSRFCLSELAALWGRERSVTVVYSEQDVVLRAAPIGQRSVMSPMPAERKQLPPHHLQLLQPICRSQRIEQRPDVFGTPHDAEISVFQPSQIARVEPSFRIDSSSRFLWGSIVTFHNVRPAYV